MRRVLFYLGRHGRTAANKEDVYRAWSNAPEAQLSDEGREDARAMGRFLKGRGVKLILADSLDRVQETAELAAAEMGGAEIEHLRELHPLDVGNFTLKSKDEHPLDEYIANPGKKIPGGESLGHFNKRQAGVFKGIVEAAKKHPGQILVLGHGSNVSFLHNHVFGTDEPRTGYEGLVDPGGIIEVRLDGMTPILKARSEKKQTIVKKVDPAVVLYLSPVAIGELEGARCGRCMMFVPEKEGQGHCTVVAGSINGATGVCGLYVHGEHEGPDMHGMLEKVFVGYVENGPTHCMNCEYMEDRGLGKSSCVKVAGIIEGRGCCNAWEEEE